jgi:predicted dehydrogenase
MPLSPFPSGIYTVTPMKTLTTLVAALALAAGAGVPFQARQPAQAGAPAWASRPLRAGIIGTDTSHVPQFTKILHSHPEWKITVVAAYKGGSPDLPISATRVDKFAAAIQQDHGVEIVGSIDALLSKVDVVLLASVDGRPHLEQARPVLTAGKRVFIDKPLAASLDDARRIVELSRSTGTPFFSASSVRYHGGIPEVKANRAIGTVRKVQANYVLNIIEHHPDLFYYGIHGVEALYQVMGRGCERLTRARDHEADVTTCTWKDGRIGVYRGLPKADPALPLITVWGERGEAHVRGPGGSEPLVERVAEFFHTGRTPVDVEETLEVFEFMTAAQLSKERNGAPVSLAELRPGPK